MPEEIGIQIGYIRAKHGSESNVADSRPDLSASQGSGQILQFRLRQRVPTPASGDAVSGGRPDGFDDLAQYEEDDIHIDYRHRMLMNVIAVMVVAALIGAGVWIADTISDMEKTQDCLMQGRQNCAPIVVPMKR